MKVKVNVMAVAVLSALMLLMGGCAKYEQIKVTSANVESVSLNGFKSVDVRLVLDVDNPAGKVVLKKSEGVLKHFGKVIGKVTPGPVTLRPRTMAAYSVDLRLEIAEGVGLKEILMLADPRAYGECTLDVEVSGTAAGVAFKKKYKDIPLKKLLESKRNEKI